MEFSDIVKRELRQKGKTQRWLAAKLGITPGAVTKSLYGNPTIDVVRRINAVLPLPEFAAFFDDGPDGLIHALREMSIRYADVLNDPSALADFEMIIAALTKLPPERRRGLIRFLVDPTQPE